MDRVFHGELPPGLENPPVAVDNPAKTHGEFLFQSTGTERHVNHLDGNDVVTTRFVITGKTRNRFISMRLLIPVFRKECGREQCGLARDGVPAILLGANARTAQRRHALAGW